MYYIYFYIFKNIFNFTVGVYPESEALPSAPPLDSLEEVQQYYIDTTNNELAHREQIIINL